MEWACGSVRPGTPSSSVESARPLCRIAAARDVTPLGPCPETHRHRRNSRKQPLIYWVLSFSTNTKKLIVRNWVTSSGPEQYMMTPRWCGPFTLPKCWVTASTRKNLRSTRPDTAAQWTCLVSFWPRNVRPWSVTWTINIFCMSGRACPTRTTSSTLGKLMTSRVTWVLLGRSLRVQSSSESRPGVLTSANGLEFVCIFLNNIQLNVQRQFLTGSPTVYFIIFLPQKLYVKKEIRYILSILYRYISSW